MPGFVVVFKLLKKKKKKKKKKEVKNEKRMEGVKKGDRTRTETEWEEGDSIRSLGLPPPSSPVELLTGSLPESGGKS